MVNTKSPFAPAFGSSPPVLAGREELIRTFIDGLEDGPGSSARFSMYYGPRGIGKTVLLNSIEESAKREGWIVISETCTPGLTSRLIGNGLPDAYDKVPDSIVNKRRLTGVNIVNIAGSSWENEPQRKLGLREWIEKIANTLESHGTGLLITLDEINPVNLNEIIELVTVIQLAFRQNLNVAFAGTTLSTFMEELLDGTGITFLRRADWNELNRVSITDAKQAIYDPIINNGRTISKEIARKAAMYTEGYCYLIQLVGDLMWKQQPDNETITEENLVEAIKGAKNRIGRKVLAPELTYLPDVQRSYLLAMAQEIKENGQAKTSAVVSRIGKDINYGGVYRERLIQRGLIFASGYGLVDFVIPGMGEYILEHTS